MRNIINYFVFLGLFIPMSLKAQSSLCGIITAETDDKPIAEAKVYLRSSDGTELFTMTDSRGLFMLNGLRMDTYSLIIDADTIKSRANFSNLEILAGMFRMEQFTIADSSYTDYLYKNNGWALDSTKIEEINFDEDERPAFRAMDGMVAGVMSKAPKRGTPPPPPPPPPVVEEVFDDVAVEEVITYSSDEESADRLRPLEKDQRENAGQLTASEWNDLANWDLWSDQIEEEFLEFAEVWKLKPANRVSIDLRNNDDEALVHATVILKDLTGEILAKGKTDNKGRAELFLKDNPNEKKYDLLVEYMGSSFDIKSYKLDKKAPVNIDAPCANNNLIEIMFVVDATGSMGDEIRYLQAEVQDVVNRIANMDQTKTVRSGAIFYRDHSDNYLSRRKDLSTDTESLNTFIQEQRAGGGGDFPEAIDYALKEVTETVNWSEQAISKIAFLILDAPPHDDNESIERIHNSMKKAAEKGIRLIPITGSGIDKSTEYLMKAMAVLTNGTYLYLTDDSGIGNSHIVASNDKSEVELLNDLMVRIVSEMSSVDCFEAQQTDTEILNEWSSTHEVDVFPNPTSDYVNIKTKIDYEQLTIYSLDGQKVLDFGKVTAGIRQIDITELIPGTYILVLSDAAASVSLKLVVK